MIRHYRLVVSSFIVSSIILLTTLPAYANPGAWTQAPGQWQLIVNAVHYSTDSRFDNRGRKVSQPTYRKQELNPYLEYGLTDRYTLMFYTVAKEAHWKDSYKS